MSLNPSKQTKDFLIRNIPIDLYQKLEQSALQHHRSKVQEAIVILSNGLCDIPPIKKPKPFQWKKKVNARFIQEAIKKGRS